MCIYIYVYFLGNGINTSTFTRPKKKSMGRLRQFNGTDGLDSNGIERLERQRSDSIDTLSDEESGMHRLTDVGDVKEVARMQEECK